LSSDFREWHRFDLFGEVAIATNRNCNWVCARGSGPITSNPLAWRAKDYAKFWGRYLVYLILGQISDTASISSRNLWRRPISWANNTLDRWPYGQGSNLLNDSHSHHHEFSASQFELHLVWGTSGRGWHEAWSKTSCIRHLWGACIWWPSAGVCAFDLSSGRDHLSDKQW